MRAAGMFVASLAADGEMDKVAGIRVELFGSLGATGHGHDSVKAVVLGLTGAEPETVDPAAAGPLVGQVRKTGRLRLPAGSAGPIDTAGSAGPIDTAGSAGPIDTAGSAGPIDTAGRD